MTKEKATIKSTTTENTYLEQTKIIYIIDTHTLLYELLHEPLTFLSFKEHAVVPMMVLEEFAGCGKTFNTLGFK